MIRRWLVMVQREVGERLAAGVGDDAYGAVSVKIAYYATAKVVGTVSPNVFIPKPKVESALGAARAARRAAGAGRRCRSPVRARARRLRDASQDAAQHAGRPNRRGAVRHAPVSIRRRAPKPSRSPTGRGSPMPEIAEIARRRVREAHAFAAHHRNARRRLSRARRDDGFHHRAARLARHQARVAYVSRRSRVRSRKVYPPTRRTSPGARPMRAASRSRSHCTRASRRARASAAVRPTRPQCSSRSAPIPRSPRRWAPMCRSACGAASRVSAASARSSTPVRRPTLAVVVATPPFSCATAAVYGAWDALGGPRHEPNDLQPGAEMVEPRLVAFKREVEAAAGAPAILAGSGSSYAVVFEDPDDAAAARARVAAAIEGSVWLASTSPVRRRSRAVTRNGRPTGAAAAYLPC